MEVTSSLPNHLPTMSTAKASEIYLLLQPPIWWRSGRWRHFCSIFYFSVPAISPTLHHHHQLRTMRDRWASAILHQLQECGLGTLCWSLRRIHFWSWRNKNCRTSQEDHQESSELGHWPLHSGRPHSSHPTNSAGISQIACRLTRSKAPTNSLRRNAQRSRQKDPKQAEEDKRSKWQSSVDKCDHRTATSHIWRLVKGLSGKKTHNSTNKGVRFAEKAHPITNKIANKLAHQFTPPPIRRVDDKSNSSIGNSIICY